MNFRADAFAQDVDGPILDRDLQPATGEGSSKDQLLGALGNIDESARAGEPGAEAADIDIAGRIRLRHAETSEVETAAVVKIELLILMHDGIRIERGAKIEPALRHSADDAGLGGQGKVLQHMLFGRDRGNPFRHADAEIDDAAGRQLERTAPRDNLALVKLQRHDPVHRHALPARKGMAVAGAIGLQRGFPDWPRPRNRPGYRESATSRGLSELAAAMRST